MLAVNGQSAVVVSYDSTWKAQSLDSMGHPDGAVYSLPSPAQYDGTLDDVEPAGDGYVLGFSGWTGTWLLRIRNNGTPVTYELTLVEGPYVGHADSYHSERVVVSASGNDAVILIEGVKSGSDTELKTAVVDANGSIKRAPQSIYTMPGDRSLFPAALRWDGSEFVAAIGVSHDPTGNFTDVDPALLRINGNGDRTGDLNYVVIMPRRQAPMALAWNGREFLVPWYDTTSQASFGQWVTSVPQSTMRSAQAQQLGRTLDAQTTVSVGAMNGQYLVAWIETAGDSRTVRASRLDAEGNYLDGSGIIVSSTAVPALNSYAPTLSIDNDGNNWFVVFADGTAKGVFISKSGTPLGGLVFGAGTEAAVRWNGTNYCVVYSDGSLHSAAVSRDGAITARNTLATSQYAGSRSLTFRSPAIATSNGEFLATFAMHDTNFADIASASAIRLDATGAARDSVPYTIGSPMWGGRPAVATDGERYLVVWSKGADVAAVFVSPGATLLAGNTFVIDEQATSPAVTYDGHDFVVTWRRNSPQTIGQARVGRDGSVTKTTMRLDNGELVVDIPDIAATATMPALIAFDHRHDAYDGVPRSAALFAREIGDDAAILLPNVPGIIDATRVDADGVVVHFRPITGALGVAMDLRLADGTYREIGVASAGASVIRGSLAGLEGTSIRLRGWSAVGFFTPSDDVPLTRLRRRSAGR
jgi:hypothetical protein